VVEAHSAAVRYVVAGRARDHRRRADPDSSSRAHT